MKMGKKKSTSKDKLANMLSNAKDWKIATQEQGKGESRNNFNKNLLICGDNLKVLDDLKKRGIQVDLIYLDPPFFSNRHYEVVWGDEAEVRSFKDRWAGGIHVYIEWMKERIKKMAEVLKDSGSFYLHCDPHASHHLKIMLDNVLGHQNFRSEIHWQRTSSHSDSKKWPNIHDTIFYYARERATWNPQYLAHSPEYVSKFYRYKDDRGVYRHDHIIRSASMGPRPNLAYEYKGYTPKWGWRMLRDKVEVLDNDNRIAWTKTGRPYLKRYLHEQWFLRFGLIFPQFLHMPLNDLDIQHKNQKHY